MLGQERFQTVFKSLARGTRNVMQSICNHYLMLEVALSNRLTKNVAWTTKAPRSSSAGFAARFDSRDKADRMAAPLGAGKADTLTMAELREVRVAFLSVLHSYYHEFF